MPFRAGLGETPEAYLGDFNTPQALSGPRLRDPDTPETLSGLRASNSDIPAALSGPISGLPGPPGNKIGYQNLLWICLAGPQSGQPENLGIRDLKQKNHLI